jgi:uncharacterized membrane protein YbhN (UPF0104 family)
MSGHARLGRRLLTFAVVAAAFGFLYHTAAANWRDLRQFEWRVDAGFLVLSIVAHVGVLAWGVWIWSRVLRHFPARPVPYPVLLRIWSLSNAARYIPGAVWQFMTAAQLSRGAGLPGVLALTSMLVHVALSLLAAITISALSLPFRELGLELLAPAWARTTVVLLCFLVVHPAVINQMLRLVPRALRREVLVWTGRWADGAGLLVLSVGSWLLYGVAYTLFVASLAPLSPAAFPTLTAVNALSFMAGYLAVLAPGGIGVRESAMTLLLTPLLPAGVAAVVAVGARLWSVVAEVLLAASGMLAAQLVDRAQRAGRPTP